MKTKNLNLYLVVIVTLVALGVFGTVLAQALWYDPESEEVLIEEAIMPAPPQPESRENSREETPRQTQKVGSDKPKPEPEGHPVRLVVPALGINAKVQKVGINKKGNMATPTNFKDVGWYKYGTVPGELGSAVIAGHVDNGLAFPGVFKRLGELKKGDDIFIETDDGRKIRFVVEGTQVYNYDAEAPEVFSGQDGHYLKLVTCTGTWLETARTHNERLVVTAIKAI